MRYFLEIAYKGTNYHGWQFQTNAYTLQKAFQDALELLFKKHISTLASGRTDTGVHALQQFVQLDLDQELTEFDIFRLNKILSADIVIKDYYKVTPSASARFDAISRTYEYRIIGQKNPFLQKLSYELPADLDIASMNAAAMLLFNHEDFESFSKVHTDVKSFLCTIIQAHWSQQGEFLIFTIEANRFLRGMVRTIVGTLLKIGFGQLTIADFNEIILKKSRKAASAAAHAQGLFLTQVKYPDAIFLDKIPK